MEEETPRKKSQCLPSAANYIWLESLLSLLYGLLEKKVCNAKALFGISVAI